MAVIDRLASLVGRRSPDCRRPIAVDSLAIGFIESLAVASFVGVDKPKIFPGNTRKGTGATVRRRFAISAAEDRTMDPLAAALWDAPSHVRIGAALGGVAGVLGQTHRQGGDQPRRRRSAGDFRRADTVLAAMAAGVALPSLAMVRGEPHPPPPQAARHHLPDTRVGGEPGLGQGLQNIGGKTLAWDTLRWASDLAPQPGHIMM